MGKASGEMQIAYREIIGEACVKANFSPSRLCGLQGSELRGGQAINSRTVVQSTTSDNTLKLLHV